ncbi:response regulator transcription factor [Microbacterium sp. No. 7]|uniref:response regulator transcription factor n=1 Tax=Microbacterium sp. No. 7 TaxID=1714373 RepID=UPI0006D09046|nr:response regulator transcription factor [Microbacterium sp. No. 7]ALJ21028.1 hypothetical protein AOA12_14420 [Microbacterium sp. No. 7]
MSTPVLIVDDHRTFVDLMKMGIDAQDDLHCAGVAHSLREATRIAAAVPYEAAIVDLSLPDGTGAEVVAVLREAAPDARLVVLTAHPRSDVARRASAAGAHAVLPKNGRLADVLKAVRARGVAPVAPSAGETLTPREREVLSLLADGQDAQAIATLLGLSLHTVRDHVKGLLAGLGAKTQLEAVVLAARAGIVLLEPR